MAHVNTTTVQTAEGAVEVTKTSTHRDYVVASAAQRADGTQAVLSWHLTRAAGEKYIRSTEANRIARHGEAEGVELILLPVTVTLTGKDKVAAPAEEAAPEAPVAAPVAVPAEGPDDTNGTCRCGCGEAIGNKSQYRPGHDARHASAVAADIASSSLPYYERVTADSDLGSEALVAKAHAQAEKLIAKMQAKAARLEAKRSK